ncbi:hypothetical protein LCGC14_1832160 [marine sediment metagenome]|uniref:Spore protein YkvP/CgeB glycosyl transferase-like domain-containing protein n=1 Tax=marine sediment metagenome TaxID=412755 RepID=A0A0F9GFQ0_9ZZZZ
MNEQVLQAIRDERGRQDAKWGVQRHEANEWLAILMEELGEAARATLEGDPVGYVDEVVHVGTLRQSRLEFLVNVAERFLKDRPGWSWSFMGLHEPLLAWFQQNVAGRTGGRLVGVGMVPHAEIAGRLCRAKIGVNYHTLESRQIQVAIPLKVFEYLACGLAVVTTRVPMLVELVTDCPAVALAGEDADSYLAALDGLARRDDLARLAEEARRFSDERFNCRAEGVRLAAMYEDILKDR